MNLRREYDADTKKLYRTYEADANAQVQKGLTGRR
jgi:hypothetical protein